MPIAALNGINLYYETRGNGFPIVLAHGYCTSVRMWKHQIPLLSQKYKVIAYDARGHGLSTAPGRKEDYTLTKLVEDLYELLRYLEVPQAYIAGHSMGGATTIGFAAKHPEMTKAALICNIDGAHLPDDPQRDKADEETTKRNHQFVRERGLADFARHQIATKMAPRFILEDEDQQRAFVERYAHQSLNGYFGVFAPGEPLPWREPWLKEAARSLKMPVAIIAGTEDRLRAGAESMHQHIPQSHFVLIENAPHDSMNARPDAFNKGFLEFLENVEHGRTVAGSRIV